jgi:hypothetical protein
MFEVFAGKVRSFKERFFLVRPRSVTTMGSLFEAVEDGVQERRPFFPLCWFQDHFRYEPKDFGRTVTNLSEEEIDIRQQLWAFVQSLPRRTKTDKRGNPLMSADGAPISKPRLILIFVEPFCFSCLLFLRSDDFFLSLFVLHKR